MASPRTPRKSAYDPIKVQITSHKALERKALEFDITLHEVSFNYAGRYFLKLSVNSSFTSDLSSLRVRAGRALEGPTRGFRFGAEARTEVTDELMQDQVYPMNGAVFSFYMPVGFNKNDIKHDVYLLIEAFDISDETAQFRRIGEARMAIYPRTDVEMKFDLEIGDPIYRFSSKSPILRTNTQDAMHMHCGSVSFTCQLIEAWPIDDDGDTLAPLPPPKPRKKQPEPKPKPATKQKEPPVRMTPRGQNAQPQRLREDPIKGHRAADPMQAECHLVAPFGKEEVTIVMHGANDIRHPTEDRMMRTYVTVQTKGGEDLGKPAQGVTYATVKATDSPAWEEMMNVTIDANRAPDEVVVVKIGDKQTQELIHEFRIPVGALQPFHHYHLNMHRFNEEQGRVFASVVRKQHNLPEPGNGLNFKALEACLIGVKQPLQNPAGALICVGKVVSDYYNFVNQMLAYRNSGLGMTAAKFPNPHPTTFYVNDRWTGQGQAQVTLPGRPVSRPQWQHPFLFCDHRELATLFTVGAALVLEFYDFNNAAVNESEWRTSKPVAYSALLLDGTAYKQLSEAAGGRGVWVELPMQGSQLRTAAGGKLPSVLLQLRLHDESSPANQNAGFLTNGSQSLPQLMPTHIEVPRDDFVDEEAQAPYGNAVADAAAADGRQLEWEWDPYRDLSLAAGRRRRNRLEPITDGNLLPSEHAVEAALPDYGYIFPAAPTHRHPKQQQQQQQQQHQQEQQQQQHWQQATLHSDSTGQLQQLQRYKEALRHMGQDILSLRDRIAELQRENAALSGDVVTHTDMQFLIRDSADLGSISKPDLISRYASLKNNLIASSSELSQYKQKLQQLQQRAGQQQQQQAGLTELTNEHESQQPLVQQLQAKAAKQKKLEAACAKQQQVMDRMQRLLAASRPHEAVQGETLSKALVEENRRLREEVSLLRDSRERQKDNARVGDAERVELYQLLDTADTRIAALESQVTDRARKWQKERAKLQDRLLAAKSKSRN